MYKHTFYLHDGTKTETYSRDEGIGYIGFKREVSFIAYDENFYMRYTIPFTSVAYIETEEIEE